MAVSEAGGRALYTFGDSATAAVRLARVARVFAPSTEAFVARLEARSPRRVLDLGCGPGHTTRLLARLCPVATVLGIDQSDAFLDEARRTPSARTSFAQADVTGTPLPGAPADLIFARFVLAHLRNRPTVLRGWFEALVPRGIVAVEEVDRIETDDEVFREYLAITAGLVADRGGELYVGLELSGTARGLPGHVIVDAATRVEPATADVAMIFGLNLHNWRSDPWVVAHRDARRLGELAGALRTREDASGGGRIRWTLRQVAVARD